MSSVTQSDQSRNQITSDYDFSKLFLFNNEYRTISFTNSTGSELELEAGTVIGVVTSTYQIYKSGTSNISFVGVLAESITMAIGEVATLNICISGEVAEDNLVFDGTDTLATVVDYSPIRDIIASESAGIILKATTQLSANDN